MPGCQELSLLLEYLADSLLVEARGISHVGVGVIEGFLLDVVVKPPRHAVIVYHFRKSWPERPSTRPAGVAATDHPEGDPLSVDG